MEYSIHDVGQRMESAAIFFLVPRAIFRMRMKGSHKMYGTIWLRVDLCQSPLLLPDGGGWEETGYNFPCAESQIVARWKMGRVNHRNCD